MSNFLDLTVLFNSVEAASEIAFYLKGEWDGCNAVRSDGQKFDCASFNQAIALVELELGRKVEYCYVRDSRWAKNLIVEPEDRKLHQNLLERLNFLENDPQVKSLLVQLQSTIPLRQTTFLLSTYEYSLSLQLQDAFWIIDDYTLEYNTEIVQTAMFETKQHLQCHWQYLAQNFPNQFKFLDLKDFENFRTNG
ncbi:hypothetical protein HC931_07670 [Candidatus Gracilibacteria bacterium]|nr:hypothetical protein [Candidatus Gracilibacteria bacterium]NJM89155.1 hypothetical protein [Hydrococcus sp. RU_2_2]NJP20978.1 hypothetical protein [Hydrococcus sp. CRU_1_1]